MGALNDPSGGTMPVRYSCPKCGLADVEARVLYRPQEQPIEEWMVLLGVTLSNDHADRSAKCRPDQLVDIKIR